MFNDLTLVELNDLYYALGTAINHTKFGGHHIERMERLQDEVWSRIVILANEDEPEYDSAGFSIEDREPHYVSNEEADEDARTKFNGATQAVLDFVQKQGNATYTEMNDFYRKTFGSNSFSHILRNLAIPYKNRETRRYLYRADGGVWVVKVANPTNWIVK